MFSAFRVFRGYKEEMLMANSLFFWLSKLIWMIIRPDFLLVAFAVMGISYGNTDAVSIAEIGVKS